MRKLLLLALLLYDIALANRLGNYDYDDSEGSKRHPMVDDRRNWRKKGVLKPMDMDHKEWDDRRRHEYEGPRYADEDIKPFGRDSEAGYRSLRYEDDKQGMLSPKSSEHHTYADKESEKRSPMNCERPHERYEACLAGCASVTCDNPRDRLRPCYPFCESGCVCIPPYVRDDRTHKCVLIEDCTKGLKGIPDIGDEVV